MKILRREHRRQVRGDLNFCIGLLQNIRKVVFKGYNTSGITLDIDCAIASLTTARMQLPKTKLKIQYKQPRALFRYPPRGR